MNHPDPKKHQLISFAKSGLRILASAMALAVYTNPVLAVFVLALGYGVAEVVGIVEELV